MEKKLWENYKLNKTIYNRNKLIEFYYDWLKIVVTNYYSKNLSKGRHEYMRNIDLSDLYSYGVIGLIDAISKFDTKKKIKFKTYASHRIIGQIIDELRKFSYSIRGKFIINNIEHSTIFFNVEYLDKLLKSQTNINNEECLCQKDLLVSYFDEPIDLILKKEKCAHILDAVFKLPDNIRDSIFLCYYENLSDKEISTIIDKSVSTIYKYKNIGKRILAKTLDKEIIF